MALVLDYEFDTFSTDTDGTRKVVDSSGNANDGTVESGQGLETDGVDDYVDTNIYPDDSFLTIVAVFQSTAGGVNAFGCNDGNSRRFYVGTYNTSAVYVSYGDSVNYVDIGYDGTYPISVCVSYDPTANSVKGCTNTQLLGPFSASRTTGTSTMPFYLGKVLDSSYFFTGKVFMVAMLDITLTDTEMLYINSNIDEFLNVANGVDNPNLSFSKNNFLSLLAIDEGFGNTIYDSISGQSHNMVNFPTDDTQWTNADNSQYGHQKLRFKKDANGNPSALADPKTVRFD